jgi:hypothetical protein
MSFYKQRELYLQQLAEGHELVKHNQPVSVDDETPRQSFFRINDEEELNAASTNWIHFPCVVMIGLSGGLLNKSGSIRQLNINTWLFLQKMQRDDTNPIDATAITDAYDTTFGVMQDFIKKVNADFEEDPSCGVFADIDLGRFKWEQAGPMGDELYGWILTFSDETKASF